MRQRRRWEPIRPGVHSAHPPPAPPPRAPALPDLIDLYKTADAGCTAALLGKLCVERSYSSKLDDVRSSIQQRLVAGLREYRLLHGRGMPGMGAAGLSPNALVLPERLKALPLLTLGAAGWAAVGCVEDVGAYGAGGCCWSGPPKEAASACGLRLC